MPSDPKYPKVILKKGREKAVQNRHHWIFSGAIQTSPDFTDGAILSVYSSVNKFLGYAYFNRSTSIAGRMISFEDKPLNDVIRKKITDAIMYRRTAFSGGTNAFRLVNSEGDFLPGLTADLYNDVLVLQISTLGMEKMKGIIVDIFEKEIKPLCIYEKSTGFSRREENLDDHEDVLRGAMPELVDITENGFKFKVDIKNGQKTGFYLDQRSSRQLVKEFSGGRDILNAFSYTGAFTVYACKGGAKSVCSVDESENALTLARRHLEINDIPSENAVFRKADVFDFLRKTDETFDLIILDPPRFARKKEDTISACRGYKDINRLAFKLLRPKGFLFTSSCSYFIDELLFQKVVFQAAVDSGRDVRIIGRHRLSFDHPINIYHPESSYLKSLLLYVE